MYGHLAGGLHVNYITNWSDSNESQYTVNIPDWSSFFLLQSAVY